VPTGIVTLAADPLHPRRVAAAMGAAVPSSVVTVLPTDAGKDDVAAIGSACVDAWIRAGEAPTFSASR
jgi:hypothetical protein